MMQVISQAAKATTMALKEAEKPVNATISVQVIPRTGGPAPK